MEDLLELAEDMLQHLPAKTKRVLSDKLAKWKAGEDEYSTQQKITDAGVWHSAVFTCIIVKKLNSLKHLVRTTVAELNN